MTIHVADEAAGDRLRIAVCVRTSRPTLRRLVW